MRLLNQVDRRVLRSMMYVPAMAAVFLMFRITEWLLEHYLSASKGESLAVALAIAIGLAVVFQLFHHRVETIVEHWLNRGAHTRMHGLEALAEEVTLIADPVVLQQRVLDRIEEMMLTRGAAIYLGRHDDGFALVRSNGDSNPPAITKDDPVVIHLRLHHRPTAPKAVGSPAPFPMLWPMLVRGDLIGFLSAGERRHKESLDPGEIKAVSVIAEAVGVALAMLDPALSGQAAAPIDDGMPSIAVLPFVNMSRDQENEYFADGLSEELLNVLARVRGLRVASRTSAFSFKGQNIDIPTIARKLNVATVLEGSVRASGKRVRVTAQLIQVATDSHLWSETYDRELDDIFAVQDDIAQTVLKELRRALLGEEPDAAATAKAKAEIEEAAKGRSTNPEAYRLYLEAQFFRAHLTRESIAKAIEYYEKAVAIDPEYALAWAGLSRARSDQAGQNWGPLAEGYEAARAAAMQAIALEPQLSDAHTALGWVQRSYDWDWQGAEASFLRALEVDPQNALSMNAAAILTGNLGMLDEAVELLQRAIKLDPLNVSIHRNLGLYALAAGDLTLAQLALTETLQLSPQAGLTNCWLALVRLKQQRNDEALAAALREVNEIFRLVALAVVHHAMGDAAPSDESLHELIDQHSDSPYQIAEVLASRNEADAAFEWLERTYANRDPGLAYVKMDPLMQPLREDARWQPFLGKMRLAG